MIGRKRLFKTIQKIEASVSEEIVNKFYDSIPLSYIFYKFGPLGFDELYRIETENSFPLLKEIISRMNIWIKFGADEKTAREFANHIEREKKTRDRNGDWVELRSVIYDRLALYPKIFNFSKEDLAFCDMAAEEYRRYKLKTKNKK